MKTNKYAVGIIKTDDKDALKFPKVKVSDGEFLIANREVMEKEGYPQAVLVKYVPDDQYAYIVTMKEVEKAMTAIHAVTMAVLPLITPERSEVDGYCDSFQSGPSR